MYLWPCIVNESNLDGIAYLPHSACKFLNIEIVYAPYFIEIKTSNKIFYCRPYPTDNINDGFISISPACYIEKSNYHDFTEIPVGKCKFNLVNGGAKLTTASMIKLAQNHNYAKIPFLVNLPVRSGMNLCFELLGEIQKIKIDYSEPNDEKLYLIGLDTKIYPPPNSADNENGNDNDNTSKPSSILPKEKKAIKTPNDILFNSLVRISIDRMTLLSNIGNNNNNHSHDEICHSSIIKTGILISGPSGVGKSHVVLSFLEKAGIPFEYFSSQHNLYSQVIGETEENIKRAFQSIIGKFKKSKHAQLGILCLDDFEVIGSTPKNSVEWQIIKTITDCILSILENEDNILILAITNKPESIWKGFRKDSNILSRELKVGIPNNKERLAFLQEFCEGIQLSFDLEMVSKKTVGYLARDLNHLTRAAILNATKRFESQIKENDDLSAALEDLSISSNDHPHTISNIIGKNEKSIGILDFSDFDYAFKSVQPSIFKDYHVPADPRVTWGSIGGLDDIRDKIRKLVEWPLTRTEEYKYFGIRPPRGILLYGPPGCSKTTIAKAIANNGGFAFFAIDSASLFSAYVGESERILRQIFNDARATQPSVIFFDEIETLVGKRGASNGDLVQEHVLSTMLNEIDGIDTTTTTASKDALVIVIGATNRPQDIDEALLRPGRFDYKIEIPLPNLAGRLQIFKLYAEMIPISPLVNLESFAAKTEGFSGADIKGLFDASGLSAISRRSDIIDNEDFVSALDNSYKSRKSTITTMIDSHFHS